MPAHRPRHLPELNEPIADPETLRNLSKITAPARLDPRPSPRQAKPGSKIPADRKTAKERQAEEDKERFRQTVSPGVFERLSRITFPARPPKPESEARRKRREEKEQKARNEEWARKKRAELKRRREDGSKEREEEGLRFRMRRRRREEPVGEVLAAYERLALTDSAGSDGAYEDNSSRASDGEWEKEWTLIKQIDYDTLEHKRPRDNALVDSNLSWRKRISKRRMESDVEAWLDDVETVQERGLKQFPFNEEIPQHHDSIWFIPFHWPVGRIFGLPKPYEDAD